MPVCDICDQQTEWSDGYVLNTSQVVTTLEYWKFALQNNWAQIHQFDPNGDTLGMYIKQLAVQQTGWLVCESCSKMFHFKKGVAKTLAINQNSNPPGSGPANLQDVAVAATTAWHELYGTMPNSVQKNNSRQINIDGEANLAFHGLVFLLVVIGGSIYACFHFASAYWKAQTVNAVANDAPQPVPIAAPQPPPIVDEEQRRLAREKAEQERIAAEQTRREREEQEAARRGKQKERDREMAALKAKKQVEQAEQARRVREEAAKLDAEKIQREEDLERRESEAAAKLEEARQTMKESRTQGRLLLKAIIEEYGDTKAAKSAKKLRNR